MGSSVRAWGIGTRRAGKMYRTRSRLYRSRFFHAKIIVCTQLKALAEIYTIHSFAQLESNLKTMKSASGKRHPLHSFALLCNLNFCQVCQQLIRVCLILTKPGDMYTENGKYSVPLHYRTRGHAMVEAFSAGQSIKHANPNMRHA